MKRILAACLFVVTLSAHAQSTANSSRTNSARIDKIASLLMEPPASSPSPKELTAAELRAFVKASMSAHSSPTPLAPDQASVKIFAGTYKYTTPPGFPFPGTDTITLSADGKYHYDVSMAEGKMGAFAGTWTAANGVITVVNQERFYEGKPYPWDGSPGWKPGNTMKLKIVGDKLYKVSDTDMSTPFTRVQK